MDGKKSRFSVWLIPFGVLLFASIVGVLAYTQLKAYERGVMEIYADQQDGYVRLVLDQINLNKNRSNDQIISEILATLDESSNKYWTLSQRDALVFVRDVMETSRYRGFSTETYFNSETARVFVASLKTDEVIHRTIQLGSRRFVASGVQFEYKGELLRICLLTSADVVLDHNDYLSAKINLTLLALIELSVLVLVSIGMAALAQKWRRDYEREAKSAKELRGTIEQLNAILNRKGMYDNRLMAFQDTVLPQLFQKMESRDVWPLSFVLLSCSSAEVQDRFLTNSQIMLDRRVFRVILDEQRLLLISARDRSASDQAVLTALRDPGIVLRGTLTVHSKPAESLETVYRRFYQDRMDVYGT